MQKTEIDGEDIVHKSPADSADLLERIPESSAQELLRELSPLEIARIVAELETDKAASLLVAFDIEKLIAILALLPPHRIADLLPGLPAPTKDSILTRLPADISAVIQSLLRYPPDSAGGIMDHRVINVRSDEMVSEALATLRAGYRQRSGDIAYIYVVDSAEKLIGVVSLRDLVFNSADTRLAEILNPEVTFLRVTDDQEEISKKMQHYPYLGFPVVDESQRLVGVVRIQDAIRVAQTEATEDMQLMVGLSGEERIWTPWKDSIKKRLPWLGINLGTALGGAIVVSFFEGTIARWSALVAFLPLISAVAGNGGNQALTVIIRSLALGEVAAGDARRALRKELSIGAVNGLVLALAIGLIAFAWKQSPLLGVVAGSAMVLNQMIGAFAGVAVPFGLKWFKIDPALASSIFVTAITDTIGFLVFLGMAAGAMKTFGI